MATLLAVRLAIQTVDFARNQLWRRNGSNGTKVAFDELKVVCPLAPGRHSLDDVHEVLVQIQSGMERLNETQIVRITDRSSKTRLTILFYAIIGNLVMLSKQNVRLLDAFEESFSDIAKDYEFDLD
jgi:hypothetical protein